MNDVKYSLGSLHKDTATGIAFRIRQPAASAPRSCVVLLHGVGGSETNLADLASGFDPDAIVVLPRGRIQLAAGQYAWFRVTFTASGPNIVASEAEDSRLTLIRFVEQMQLAYGIEPRHTVIAGFSQGGIMSASVGLSTPERVAGIGILAGRILPELEPRIAARERLATLSGFVAHGQFDDKLPVSWAQRSDDWLTELGVPHVTRLYPVAHGLSPAMCADFLAWVHGLTGTR